MGRRAESPSLQSFAGLPLAFVLLGAIDLGAAHTSLARLFADGRRLCRRIFAGLRLRGTVGVVDDSRLGHTRVSFANRATNFFEPTRSK